jgi:hypothetical protein
VNRSASVKSCLRALAELGWSELAPIVFGGRVAPDPLPAARPIKCSRLADFQTPGLRPPHPSSLPSALILNIDPYTLVIDHGPQASTRMSMGTLGGVCHKVQTML